MTVRYPFPLSRAEMVHLRLKLQDEPFMEEFVARLDRGISVFDEARTECGVGAGQDRLLAAVPGDSLAVGRTPTPPVGYEHTQVEHIDGDPRNNDLDNIRIVRSRHWTEPVRESTSGDQIPPCTTST